MDKEPGMLLLAMIVMLLAVVTGAAALLWLGLRDGDRSEDVRASARIGGLGGAEVVVRVDNPGPRPVLVAVRLRPAGPLRGRLGAAYAVRTRLVPQRLAASGMLVGVLAAETKELRLPVAARAMRVHVIAYERRGRVRASVHTVRTPRGVVVPTPQMLRTERGPVQWT